MPRRICRPGLCRCDEGALTSQELDENERLEEEQAHQRALVQSILDACQEGTQTSSVTTTHIYPNGVRIVTTEDHVDEATWRVEVCIPQSLADEDARTQVAYARWLQEEHSGGPGRAYVRAPHHAVREIHGQPYDVWSQGGGLDI